MTKKPRRYFTDEQKAEAVNIVKQLGKPVSRVAQEMGLTEEDKYWRSLRQSIAA